MSNKVVVSADRSELLPPGSPKKGWVITRQEAFDLGLLRTIDEDIQQRRVAELPQPKPGQKRRTKRN